jgi:hypothetical protein
MLGGLPGPPMAAIKLNAWFDQTLPIYSLYFGNLGAAKSVRCCQLSLKLTGPRLGAFFHPPKKALGAGSDPRI